MNPKGQHVQDNSVAERRLRPIYDWLDIGNNKKALQECDKVLKKTPTLQCAKALKALTLHRMAKEADAVGILDALTAENPTDDATLQAMTLCYRELQQLEKICKLYETAVKLEPTNEELFSHLFMSYARVFDFKSQQKTAMTLYKHKPKTPYYCWAVMSIILQATRGEGKDDLNKRKLLLSLAERMMEKLIFDGKLDAEQEVQLYVMVLELQEKYDDILKILEGPLGVKLACSNLPQNRLKYLLPLKRWEEINLLCKSVLVESVDRWDIWKEYINSVFELMESKPIHEANNHVIYENDIETVDDTPEKCHEFICRIVENGADNGFLLRGPYLARFELCAKLAERSIDTGDVLGETIELFIEYFRKFGHKPCAVSDLRTYLNLLDAEKKVELSSRLIKDVGISSTSVPKSEQQMQRHLCALQLSRLCGAHRNLPAEHLKALVTAFSLHYEHGYQTYGTNLLSTDLGPSDPYALLAAHVLYDLAMMEGSSRPIVAALVLLENMLKNSPSNFHAKLLSVRLYHTVGGCLGAQNMYNSLDTKHLQLDSLGFVHCARLSTTGLYSLCSNLFDVTLKFFSSNYKDSSDHITFSYKYGSFIKLDEFMDFRERLNNSLHYTTVAIDRIILSLVECTNLDGLFGMDISPKDDKIEWETIRDNHDLSVYMCWDPERIGGPPEACEDVARLFAQNVLFLKLRALTLWALSATVDIVKSQNGVKSKQVEQLKNVLQTWKSLRTENGGLDNVPIRQNQVTLPLPSRLHVSLDTPHFEIVGRSFEVLLRIAQEECSDEDVVDEIEAALSLASQKLEKRLTHEENGNLMYRRETMEYVVNIVEVLSVSALVCLLCNEFVKPQAKKGKKKVNESAWKYLVARLANSLKTHINQLNDLVQSWSNFSVSDDPSAILESLNLNGEGQVCETISNSYVFACREIQCVLKSKMKMLSSVS